jgi:hypothetical protein
LRTVDVTSLKEEFYGSPPKHDTQSRRPPASSIDSSRPKRSPPMVGTDGATDHAREIRWRSVSGHATDAERGMSMSNAGDSKW